MGITTPFPEPDSPELQRFVVQSPDEIVGLMHALRRRAVPLNVFMDPGAAFDVAALLEIDGDRGELLFESVENHCLREHLLGASRVTFVGFVDGVKLQFRISGVQAAADAGRPAFIVQMPTQLLRLQRRGAARARPEVVGAVLCHVPSAPGHFVTHALRVLDISADGLALLSYPGSFLPAVGAMMQGCRIEFPAAGSIQVDLHVRRVDALPDHEQALCCGCEFDGLAPSARALLDAYLLQLSEASPPSGSVPSRQFSGSVPRRRRETGNGMQ